MEKSLIVIEHGRCALFDCPFVTLCTMQTKPSQRKPHIHMLIRSNNIQAENILTEKQTGNQKSK